VPFETYHPDIECSTQIDWGVSAGISISSDERRDQSHNSVASDGDSVSSSTMRTWEHFRGVCVKLVSRQYLGRREARVMKTYTTIVDVDKKGDCRCKPHILRGGAYSRVGEEEGHGNLRALALWAGGN
jgi:hypothetical protein